MMAGASWGLVVGGASVGNTKVDVFVHAGHVRQGWTARLEIYNSNVCPVSTKSNFFQRVNLFLPGASHYTVSSKAETLCT